MRALGLCALGPVLVAQQRVHAVLARAVLRAEPAAQRVWERWELGRLRGGGRVQGAAALVDRPERLERRAGGGRGRTGEVRGGGGVWDGDGVGRGAVENVKVGVLGVL